MSQTLRPYQVSALSELRESLARLMAQGKPARSLLVAPTGSGKTTVAGEVIRGATEKGHDVLFLAHRLELIEQCSERLDGIGVDHGVILSGHDRELPGLPVQVASVQTLVRRQLPRSPKVIIVDEAHRARAQTYQKILDRYPEAVVIGLTATPMRLDGRGLGELFGELILATTPRLLIEQGYLVPYTGFAYDSPALETIKKRGSDYDAAGLQQVMGARKLVGNIVEQWQAHAADKRTVVFAVNVEHSLSLVERFRAAGVKAEHVDGETPARERRAILQRLRSGETSVVSNVAIITEGFDLPALECCVLARPTLSLVMALQMVGRVLRPAPGKDVALIHDHAGVIMEHGAPDADREWSLEYDVAKRKALRAPLLRTCKKCLRIYSPQEDGDACPSCGHVNPVTKREIREVTENVRAIPLSELPQFANASEEKKQATLATLRETEAANGYASGWAKIQYKIRFGHWPRRGAA